MNILYKLKDYRETFKFEKEHPKPLRWDDGYKMYMLTTQTEKFQGIWFKEKNELIGEILFSWQSDNVAHIDSFTVVASYRGKGLGYELVNEGIKWAEEIGFSYITGEARMGASWHIFENIGASPILLHKNWNDTGEEYMSFKLEI
jgi:GNAT superfamily N-acetyltransferase